MFFMTNITTHGQVTFRRRQLECSGQRTFLSRLNEQLASWAQWKW